MEARGGDQTRATRHTPSLSFLPYPPQKMEGEGGGMNGTGEDSRKGATGGVVSMHKTPPPFCRLLFSLTLSTLFLAVGVDQTSGNFLIVEVELTGSPPLFHLCAKRLLALLGESFDFRAATAEKLSQ